MVLWLVDQSAEAKYFNHHEQAPVAVNCTSSRIHSSSSFEFHDMGLSDYRHSLSVYLKLKKSYLKHQNPYSTQ